jgi:hypothetical protein
MLLFISPPGELWATGMCKPRYEELMKWLNAIEHSVKKNIVVFELRRHVASLEAMLMAQ